MEAALVYTLLHMFVLLQQYSEIVRERSVYEDYISQLKARVLQLEDDQQSGGRPREHDREEVVRLRRENAELRQEKAKLQASQNEVSCMKLCNALATKMVFLLSYLCNAFTNGLFILCTALSN